MIDLIRERHSPFDFPGLTTVRTVDESKAVNHIKGTVVNHAQDDELSYHDVALVGGKIAHRLARLPLPGALGWRGLILLRVSRFWRVLYPSTAARPYPLPFRPCARI